MEFPQYLIEFLGTAPYVAVLIWYTLTLRKQERDEREYRDKEWREFLAQQMGGTLKVLDEVAINLKERNECLKSVESKTELIYELLEDHDRHAERVANQVDAILKRTSSGEISNANMQAVRA